MNRSSMEIMLRANCEDCAVYKREMEMKSHGELTCCRWFMDNVICGNRLTTAGCADKEKV